MGGGGGGRTNFQFNVHEQLQKQYSNDGQHPYEFELAIVYLSIINDIKGASIIFLMWLGGGEKKLT